MVWGVSNFHQEQSSPTLSPRGIGFHSCHSWFTGKKQEWLDLSTSLPWTWDRSFWPTTANNVRNEVRGIGWSNVLSSFELVCLFALYHWCLTGSRFLKNLLYQREIKFCHFIYHGRLLVMEMCMVQQPLTSWSPVWMLLSTQMLVSGGKGNLVKMRIQFLCFLEGNGKLLILSSVKAVHILQFFLNCGDNLSIAIQDGSNLLSLLEVVLLRDHGGRSLCKSSCQSVELCIS